MRREFFRDRLISVGAFSIRKLEAVIAWGSRVGNPPVFDASVFPWSRNIEINWSLIRRELDDILTTPEILPPFQEISKDQRVLTTDNRWLTYFFYAFGYRATKNCDRCPETARLVESIP